MLLSQLLLALAWVMAHSFAAASHVPMNSSLRSRSTPGASYLESLSSVPRALFSAAILERDTTFKNSTSLEKSWNGATLFRYKEEVENGQTTYSIDVEVVCTTCYVTGTATAQFTTAGNFNLSQAFDSVKTEIENEFHNITRTAANDIEQDVKSMVTSANFDIDELDFPPIAVDFDIEIPEIPQCDFLLQFDGMEIYMEFDTTLSGGATYTHNLFTSKTQIGLGSQEGFVGVVFAVDLVLSVRSEVDISSGFHLQLNDGFAIHMSMFGQNVSGITFNGGNFEFLPVTLRSEAVVLTALLRVGVKAGIDGDAPPVTIDGNSLDFSAGLEGGIFADVAQFVTNITADSSDIIDDCKLRVVEEYSMLLGANAGATLALGEQKWGPAPTTQLPIWYTTIGDVCAFSGSATAAVSASATATATATTRGGIFARDDLTTTTISTDVTYTATACISTGLINCPVSLQSTSKTSSSITLVTSVPSGSKATFPATTQITVLSTIAFGKNVQTISPTSGSPVSYIPTPSSSPGNITTVFGGKPGSTNGKAALGIGLGVGIPVLIGIIAGCVYLVRKHRKSKYEPAPHPSTWTEPTYVDQQGQRQWQQQWQQREEPQHEYQQVAERYNDTSGSYLPPGARISRKPVPSVTVFEELRDL